MKASTVYRKAAELAHAAPVFECFACTAIARALDSRKPLKQLSEVSRYSALFNPGTTEWFAWGISWGIGEPHVLVAAHECRVLSLLLMSAIAESEGD